MTRDPDRKAIVPRLLVRGGAHTPAIKLATARKAGRAWVGQGMARLRNAAAPLLNPFGVPFSYMTHMGSKVCLQVTVHMKK